MSLGKSSDPPVSGGFGGLDGLGDNLARQRVLVAGSNAVVARLLEELETVVAGPFAEPAVSARLERAWRERRFNVYYERPLLLLAALRADAIATGPKHPLHGALARDDAPDAGVVDRDAVIQAMKTDRVALWLAIAHRRVQTNEVSRAVAWRWPAHLAGCDDGARPLALVDVGAAGGLNLVADALPADWQDPRGALLPVVRSPHIVARIGYDQHPLALDSDEDAAWVRACIWPGDRRRLKRFEEALKRRRELATAITLERLNAAFVPSRLGELSRSLPDDAFVLVYQTVVREYLPPDRRAQYLEAMTAWVGKQRRGSTAWLELELDQEPAPGPPATIVAHVPDGSGGARAMLLARCSYHPQEVHVRHAIAEAFTAATRAGGDWVPASRRGGGP